MSVAGTSLQQPCPCGSGAPYDACCGPLHRGETDARTALELMRARYCAYARDEVDYVFRTWHPRTRPADLTADPVMVWTGLRVLDVSAGGADDETGEVEFVARYRGGRLRERSRFVRRAHRWVYLEAVATA